MLSPLLYTLFTYDCCSSSPTNLIVKFADDTTVLGLITRGNEISYRGEVERLVEWCGDHNLALNIMKTKEMIIDFRRSGDLNHPPLLIENKEVERVSNFKFLGVTLKDNLSWKINTKSAVGKAQQRLFYLRKLKWARLPRNLMVNFYHCAIESVLYYGLLVWFGRTTKKEKEALRRVVRAAEKIIGTRLPDVSDVFTTRCLRRTTGILRDHFHPAHRLFNLMRLGRRYRSIRSRTNRLTYSLYPQAVRLLNKRLSTPHHLQS